MKLSRESVNFAAFSKGSVATIGNFDGVHCGHQALLAELRYRADQLSLPMVIITFEPQPSEFFLGNAAPARLTSLREKIHALKQCGTDYVYRLKFNQDLALMSAQAFAKKYFFLSIHAKYILIGEDFRFGCQREGDIALLKHLGKQEGCNVSAFRDFLIGNERVSSTTIRLSLHQGNLTKASQLLGRRFSLCGRVIRGEGRGRQWGIPTANLRIHRRKLPLQGVFAVEVARENGEKLHGVANIGTRPTISDKKNSLEVHLFDFSGNLYGELLQVFFIRKLRDEIKFPSIELLIDQIRTDISAAKTLFNA